MAYALGLDFGTSFVRALLLDCESGEEVVSCEEGYPSGIDGVIVDAQDGYLARQNPKDYLIALESAVRRCMAESALSPESIIGIGVDATASTILSVDRHMRPLSEDSRFSGNINALAWLWKDHTALNEAEEITRAAERMRPVYLSKIGGFYSPEWFFSKLLSLCRNDRKVFDAAAGFIELADYIPARLCGKRSPSEAVRSICAAGHKALFSREWGGLPDESFLASLDPGFLGLRNRLYYDAFPAGVRAGVLCAEWAEKLRIREGVPVSVGAIDAHVGAVGAGIKPGVLVSIMGTSGCDMMLFPSDKDLDDIPGICGVVPDSVVPGFLGIEAGQAAVGDIFYWFLQRFLPGEKKERYQHYMDLAASIPPGGTGLLALDWHNGNRSVLMDPKLTGMVVGLTLSTRPEELFRAFMEATGFGCRMIIERLEEYGVAADRIIVCGGLAEKNPLLMQIYADITGRDLWVSDSAQACALGAAIFGAVAAGKRAGGFDTVLEAQELACSFKPVIYSPIPRHKEIYNRLFFLYRLLHNAFGTGDQPSLRHVMKELLTMKERDERF